MPLRTGGFDCSSGRCMGTRDWLAEVQTAGACVACVLLLIFHFTEGCDDALTTPCSGVGVADRRQATVGKLRSFTHPIQFA